MGLRDLAGEAGSSRALRIAGVFLLALCLAVGLAAGDAAAKKKKKGASVFAQSVTVNAAVPDFPTGPNPVPTPLSSSLTVGKKFKGKSVGDVNVTGIQTTGDSAAGNGSAGDLNIQLSAPNGRTVMLDPGSLGGQSIGPLTLDDDT